MRYLLPLLTLAFLSGHARAKTLNVVTTTTDLAWVVKKIGQDKVKVKSLLKGTEDSHYLDAKPSFIRWVANADMVCFNGLSLEIGWLPKVLTKSGNAKVQSGGKGHCDAGQSVKAIEKTAGRIDRSMGDVHPEGNPHYSLSPNHLIQAAETVMSTMIALDVENARFYSRNYQRLKKGLLNLKTEIKKKFSQSLGDLSSVQVIQYHKEFSYFLQSYGFKQAGALETVPGVPPSAGRLAEVGLSARAKGVRIVIAANYSPKKLLKQFTRMSQVPHLTLPLSVQKKGPLNSYRKLQLYLAEQIIGKLKK